MCKIPIVFNLLFLSWTQREVIFLLFMIDNAFAARAFLSILKGFFVMTFFTIIGDILGFFSLYLLIWPSVIIPIVLFCLF